MSYLSLLPRKERENLAKVKSRINTDKIKKNVDAAVEKFQKELTPELIQEYTKDILDAFKRDNIARILGLSNHWGQWEVDHTNGRNGNSFIANEINKAATQAAIEWCEQAFSQAIKPNKAQIAAIRNEYREVFERTVTQSIRRIAEQDAGAFLQDVLTDENYEA